MKRAFCYFTGTGNSLYAAQVIKGVLRGDIDELSIPKVMENPEILKEYDEIGIFFPVYAFSAPQIVLDFIDTMPVSTIDKYVFAIATCGAYQGDALSSVEKRLEKNGITLAYCQAVVMPDNYTAVLPAPSESTIKRLLDSSEIRLKNIAHEIAVNVKTKTPKGSFGIMTTINKVFMSDGNKRDKKFILTRSCIGCGECAEICPVNNIKMEDGRPKFLGECQFCLGCLNRCPKGAINYGRATIKKPRYVNNRVRFHK